MPSEYLTWPLEESLTHDAMAHVACALETYLGKHWPLKEHVEAELRNTMNAIHSALERLPADEDLLA